MTAKSNIGRKRSCWNKGIDPPRFIISTKQVLGKWRRRRQKHRDGGLSLPERMRRVRKCSRKSSRTNLASPFILQSSAASVFTPTFGEAATSFETRSSENCNPEVNQYRKQCHAIVSSSCKWPLGIEHRAACMGVFGREWHKVLHVYWALE